MKKQGWLSVIAMTLVLSGCGGGDSASPAPVQIPTTTAPVAPVAPPTPPPSPTLRWVETVNTVTLPSNLIGNYRTRAGQGAFDLYGYPKKSFMFPSGGEFNTKIRSPNDQDFLTLSFDSQNRIFVDKNPISPKYIAGFVNDTIEGNFGYGANSLVMIDSGREAADFDHTDLSYLWRMDKINGVWSVTEFAKDLGKQFWHSSNNPLDINNDGKLDFSVSNLFSTDKKSILFVSNANGHGSINLTANLCASPGDILKSSGSSALIKLANGSFAAISMPYLVNAGFSRADQGSVVYLDRDGKPIKTDCLSVRGTSTTIDMNDREGYNAIKVFDFNNDGRQDFIALAESISGNQFKRILYFAQQSDSSFALVNNDLAIPSKYSLPNVDTADFSDWVANQFVITEMDTSGRKGIFFQTRLIKKSQIDAFGIRGGIIIDGRTASQVSIRPSSISWNSEFKPNSYDYIFPTEINNDGIVDFLLVSANGQSTVGVSALLSTK
jgi:hypothetical protein